MQCNWTEKDATIICNNLPLIKDEKNINEKYFCEMHLKQVKETRKLMHKNCISKEKLIQQLRDDKYFLEDANIRWPVININKLITEIESDKFDNEK